MHVAATFPDAPDISWSEGGVVCLPCVVFEPGDDRAQRAQICGHICRQRGLSLEDVSAKLICVPPCDDDAAAAAAACDHARVAMARWVASCCAAGVLGVPAPLAQEQEAEVGGASS